MVGRFHLHDEITRLRRPGGGLRCNVHGCSSVRRARRARPTANLRSRVGESGTERQHPIGGKVRRIATDARQIHGFNQQGPFVLPTDFGLALPSDFSVRPGVAVYLPNGERQGWRPQILLNRFDEAGQQGRVITRHLPTDPSFMFTLHPNEARQLPSSPPAPILKPLPARWRSAPDTKYRPVADPKASANFYRDHHNLPPREYNRCNPHFGRCRTAHRKLHDCNLRLGPRALQVTRQTNLRPERARSAHPERRPQVAPGGRADSSRQKRMRGCVCNVPGKIRPP